MSAEISADSMELQDRSFSTFNPSGKAVKRKATVYRKQSIQLYDSYFTCMDEIFAKIRIFGPYQIFCCAVTFFSTITWFANYLLLLNTMVSSSWSCIDPIDNSTVSNGEDEKYFCQMIKTCRNLKEVDLQFSSMTSDWKLVCDRRSYVFILLASFLIGRMIGAIVGGHLSDNLGRLRGLFVYLSAGLVVRSLSIACTDWKSFAIFQFVTGAIFGQIQTTCTTLLIETTDGKYRYIPIACSQMSVSYLFIALIAYCTSEWRMYLIFISLLSSPLLYSYLLYQESLRWLISKGKISEAAAVITELCSDRWKGDNCDIYPQQLTTLLVIPTQNKLNILYGILLLAMALNGSIYEMTVLHTAAVIYPTVMRGIAIGFIIGTKIWPIVPCLAIETFLIITFLGAMWYLPETKYCLAKVFYFISHEIVCFLFEIEHAPILSQSMDETRNIPDEVGLKSLKPRKITLYRKQSAEELLNKCSNITVANGDFESLFDHFMLLCEKEDIRQFVFVSYVMGHFFGSLIGGHLSDSFGRLSASFVCLSMTLIESPRWLISKGYYYRAAQALSEIASDLWNRASIEINVKQIQSIQSGATDKEFLTILNLFRSSTLRKNLFFLIISAVAQNLISLTTFSDKNIKTFGILLYVFIYSLFTVLIIVISVILDFKIACIGYKCLTLVSLFVNTVCIIIILATICLSSNDFALLILFCLLISGAVNDGLYTITLLHTITASFLTENRALAVGLFLATKDFTTAFSTSVYYFVIKWPLIVYITSLIVLIFTSVVSFIVQPESKYALTKMLLDDCKVHKYRKE
ncbi:Solute carrier family 22 member 7 [Trichinella nelsoni]|uniref:Solute carrier family 22 member 7 n=1 Tax=Trichinella nelsoni TaxID=6336 RepID=A0A0V0S239_9BILA|nr:Solute carrier family 22 member 7 [Trichinella nelsoni]